MSYDNRDLDVQSIIDLRYGQSYYFNIFQEGGAKVELPVDSVGGRYALYSIPLYGGREHFEGFVDPSPASIRNIVDEVYDTWT